MSTKIYYGYRVPISKLNDLFDKVRPQVFDEAEKIVRNLMEAVTQEGIDTYRKEHKFEYPEDTCRFEKVIELIKEIANKSTRAPGIDIEFSLNIWIKGRYAYIIPIGEYNFKDKIKYPKYVEDFSYFNNSDKPEGISTKEWNKRNKIWEDINLGEGVHEHNARRMNHTIIEFSNGKDFPSYWELKERIIKR